MTTILNLPFQFKENYGFPTQLYLALHDWVDAQFVPFSNVLSTRESWDEDVLRARHAMHHEQPQWLNMIRKKYHFCLSQMRPLWRIFKHRESLLRNSRSWVFLRSNFSNSISSWKTLYEGGWASLMDLRVSAVLTVILTSKMRIKLRGGYNGFCNPKNVNRGTDLQIIWGAKKRPSCVVYSTKKKLDLWGAKHTYLH